MWHHEAECGNPSRTDAAVCLWNWNRAESVLYKQLGVCLIFAELVMRYSCNQ